LASYIARYGHSYKTDTQPTDETGCNVPDEQAYGQAKQQATYKNQAADSTSIGFLILVSHHHYLHFPSIR
jgi:hypothetical protein